MRKGLLITLVVLVGLVVAADRIGVLVAEKEIAKNVQSQYDLDHRPDVTIHGFPFLTQALGGHYKHIDIGLGDLDRDNVQLYDTKVELRGVNAALSDVANGDSSKITADSATSVATVPYEVVNRYAPKGVKVSNSGSKLLVKGRISVLGIGSDVTATVKVRPDGRTIRATPEEIDAGGADVPSSVARRFFSFTVPVTVLPVGTRVSDIQVKDNGLRISMVADDVSLTGLNLK